jgi:L,D-peptidoglycan transpeptidase YkuD (ErfK/YbiS/YcfS/YnhG family)
MGERPRRTEVALAFCDDTTSDLDTSVGEVTAIQRKLILGMVAATALLGIIGFAPRPAAAQTAGQVITVEAASAHSVVAVVRTWDLESDGRYVQVGGPVLADVGIHGVGPTREGAGRTPAGVFTLTQAFGNQPNNGTRLPYLKAGPLDWWDENPRSRGYNRHVRSTSSPGGDSENLYYAGGAYAHAVVINYNMNPVIKNAGSGMFLHVGDGRSTAGCVAVPASELNFIMRWLDPALDPVISIGIGAKALAQVVTSP